MKNWSSKQNESYTSPLDLAFSLASENLEGLAMTDSNLVLSQPLITNNIIFQLYSTFIRGSQIWEIKNGALAGNEIIAGHIVYFAQYIFRATEQA